MGSLRGRIRLLFRSFLIQGSWNYRTLLGSGLAWALGPASGQPSIPGRGTEGGEASEGLEVARAAEPFNSHPYLSPIALGALTRVRRDGVESARIRDFRQALRSPLGGLGDSLVWGAWRPVCLLGAGTIALVGGSPALVTIGFLLAYNLVHFALRVRGLRVGLESGLSVATGIRGMALPTWTERIRTGGVILLGFALGLLGGRAALIPGLGPLGVAGGVLLFLGGLSGGDRVRRWVPELLLILILLGTWFAPS